MTNTPGSNSDLVVIGDTDALIAILHEDDKHHNAATATVRQLLYQEAQTVFPLTCIVETVTTLQRKLNKPRLAAKVVEKVANGELAIDGVDADLLKTALNIFNPSGSKQNTLFDAMVAALAKKRGTKVIFSFDEWYEKLGFTLASNSLHKPKKAA